MQLKREGEKKVAAIQNLSLTTGIANRGKAKHNTN